MEMCFVCGKEIDWGDYITAPFKEFETEQHSLSGPVPGRSVKRIVCVSCDDLIERLGIRIKHYIGPVYDKDWGYVTPDKELFNEEGQAMFREFEKLWNSNQKGRR